MVKFYNATVKRDLLKIADTIEVEKYCILKERGRNNNKIIRNTCESSTGSKNSLQLLRLGLLHTGRIHMCLALRNIIVTIRHLNISSTSTTTLSLVLLLQRVLQIGILLLIHRPSPVINISVLVTLGWTFHRASPDAVHYEFERVLLIRIQLQHCRIFILSFGRLHHLNRLLPIIKRSRQYNIIATMLPIKLHSAYHTIKDYEI